MCVLELKGFGERVRMRVVKIFHRIISSYKPFLFFLNSNFAEIHNEIRITYHLQVRFTCVSFGFFYCLIFSKKIRLHSNAKQGDPHIVTLLNHYETDTHVYLVMEVSLLWQTMPAIANLPFIFFKNFALPLTVYIAV